VNFQVGATRSTRSSNCLLLALLVSGCGAFYKLFFVGFDFGTYLEYNFLYTDIYFHPKKYIATPAAMVLNAGAQKWFTVTFVELLQTPWISLILGLTLKSINFFIAFKFFQKIAFLKHSVAFLLVLVLSSLISLSDLSGEIEFTRGAVAFTLVFIGFYIILSGRLLSGYTLCSVAILIHPLDAFGSLAFYGPGVLFLAYKGGELKRHVPRILPLVIAVGWIASQSPTSQVVPNLSISDWYRFILTLEGDDVALFWHLREHWFLVIPILFAGVFCALARPVGKIEAIFLGAVLFLGTILIFEAFHVLGFSAGVFSEQFISLQFRRGLWVPVFFALIVLARFTERSDVERNDAILLGGVVISGLFFPKDLVFIFFALIVFVYVIFNRKQTRHYVVGIGLAWCLVSYWLVIGLGAQVDVGFNQVAFVFIAALFLLAWKYCSPHFGKDRMVVLASSLFLVLKVGDNLAHDHSPFEQGEISKVERILKQKGSYEVRDFLLDEVISNAKSDSETAMLENLPPGARVLVAPKATGYAAPFLSQGSLSFSRWDGLVVYSRAEAGDYLEKLEWILNKPFPCPKVYGSSMACILDALATRIDAMSVKELAGYANAYGADYVVRRRRLASDHFQLIYQGSGYFVYQIDKDAVI
jgi:hypothetical protein